MEGLISRGVGVGGGGQTTNDSYTNRRIMRQNGCDMLAIITINHSADWMQCRYFVESESCLLRVLEGWTAGSRDESL